MGVSSHLYLVETSVWIRVFRRTAQQSVAERVRLLAEADSIATNELISLELILGCRTQDEVNAVRDELASLVQLSIVRSTWRRAADLGFVLRRAGIVVRVPDLLVAASAIDHDAVLLHADSDFDRIAANSALRVESYVDVAP